VQHEDGPAGRDTDHRRHGDDQPPQLRIARGIRPHPAVPPTVLLAHRCDGGLFLQGWRDGPGAYLSPSDAPAQRRELAAAFGSTLAMRIMDGTAGAAEQHTDALRLIAAGEQLQRAS
jgi:hypothetical protein